MSNSKCTPKKSQRIHPSLPKYFYFDNWYGCKIYFKTKRDAIRQAKKETGVSISIIEIGTNKIVFTKASGHTPS